MAEKFLEQYHAALSADQERLREQKEQGKNIHLTFGFTRHEKPIKRDDGLSADAIHPEGIEKARITGHGEKAEYLLVTGSQGVNRARETAQSYIQGVDEVGIAEVINKEGGEGSKLREYGVYAFSDLDPLRDIATVMQPIFAEGKQLIADGKLESEELEAWGTAKFMELPESFFQEQGLQTPREAAAELAHRLQSGIKMSAKLFSNLDVKVNNFTHSPKVECLLKFVLQKGDKIGYDSLGEIGGHMTPGEEINFVIERDNEGEMKPIKIRMRGQEFDCNMEVFRTLIAEYQESTEKRTS